MQSCMDGGGKKVRKQTFVLLSHLVVIPIYKVCNSCYYWLLEFGNGCSSRMQIRICYDNHSYTETLHTDIKRMLKRYKGQYTVMKRILIDIQRSYADLISYVYTMYPYPELSGVCIPVVPKTAYATIADQFCVISMQYTTPHTVCLRAVKASNTRKPMHTWMVAGTIPLYLIDLIDVTLGI